MLKAHLNVQPFFANVTLERAFPLAHGKETAPTAFAMCLRLFAISPANFGIGKQPI